MVASVSEKEARAAEKAARAAEKAAKAQAKANRPEKAPKEGNQKTTMSVFRSKSPEMQAIIHSSPAKRRVLHAQREAADTSPEAAERVRIAREFSNTVPFTVPREKGYLQVPPGTLSGADTVIESALALTSSIGHERLLEMVKKPFVANLLTEEALTLDSPYMKFALSEEVVGPICAYLGMVPVLAHVDVWYTPYTGAPIRSSQMWHVDYEDVHQLKVFVHCTDVGPESGPLTILDSQLSEVLVEKLDYNLGMGRVTDDDVINALGPNAILELGAKRGAASFVDTSRCFHFGSRIQEGAAPRQVVMIQYMTPYAFIYEKDHRGEARYRDLADESSSQLTKLLLGAI